MPDIIYGNKSFKNHNDLVDHLYEEVEQEDYDGLDDNRETWQDNRVEELLEGISDEKRI